MRIASAVLPAMVEQFRENIDGGRKASGEPFPEPWHDRAVFPGGEMSDRAGGAPLRDTGRLHAGLRPGAVEVRGSSVVGFVNGPDYAVRQHTGFSVSGTVVIPRTREQRERARSGDYSSIPRSDRIVARGGVTVPPREFMTVDAGRIEAVVRSAERGV